jgi:hypothetical protein
MPRIRDDILDCVFYLYESLEDAQSGESSGGTGFFVGVESEVFPNRVDTYAVSCQHVVKPKDSSSSASVIRVNTTDGGFDVINLSRDDWRSFEDIYDGEKHDIAIHEVGGLDDAFHIKGALLRSSFLSQVQMTEFRLGVGDDVFMVGRFIDHAGVQRNQPSVRFGNISMMSGEKLRHWEGYDEDSFVLDMRSLSGYSGSPVFVNVSTPIGRGISEAPLFAHLRLNEWPSGEAFLGINWSQPPHSEYLKEENRYVKVYSGMTNVIPAWYIDRLLDWPEFKMRRQQNDDEYAKKYKGKPIQKPTRATGEPKPYSEEDFERDLRKVSRPISSPPDEEKSKTSE